MNISCALMSPTPKTTFFLEAARCEHFTHASARWRNSAKAAALASGVSGGAEGTGTVSPGKESGRACSEGTSCGGLVRERGGDEVFPPPFAFFAWMGAALGAM